MASYSDSNFNAKHYNSARPTYSDEFYQELIKYHDLGNTGRELAVDVGCGPGFVAFKLTEFFKSVIGTDLSPTMIDQCNTRNDKEGVKFLVAPAEKFPDSVQESSVDLITAAECCHWLDQPKFFAECHRVLKPGATLAYWFYKDPIFVDHPKANEIYDEYTYGSSRAANPSELFEKFMGPYWEQPGRNYLRSLMREIEPSIDSFKDMVRVEYDPALSSSLPSALHISRKITLKELSAYVKSWSAYHSWMRENGDKYDVADAFIQALRDQMKWDDNFEFVITWATAYTFVRKA